MTTRFDQPATDLINSTLLVINQHFYRLVEIEFYLYSKLHPDPFCHCHPEQLTTNRWYFHRAGQKPTAKYKGGTYKGLDITFGNDDQYGGILIRAIQSVADQSVVEGPSKVVDLILQLSGVDRIDQLVNRISLDITKSDGLYLLPSSSNSSLSQFKISKGPRVGLTLKVQTESEASFQIVKTNQGMKIVKIWSGRKPYIFRSYRYGIFNLLKKEKWGFILADSTKRQGSRYEKDYLLGTQANQIDDYKMMRTMAEKCACYGFLIGREIFN